MGGIFKDIFRPVFKYISEGTPSDDDERLMCEIWLNKRDESLARMVLIIGIIFHSTSMIIHTYLVAPDFKPLVFGMHLFFFSAEFLWAVAFGKQTRVPIQRFMLVIEILAVMGFGAICHLAYFSPETSLIEKMYAGCGFMTITLLLAIVIPYHNKVVAATTGLYFLITMLFMYDGAEVSPFWINLSSTLMLTALAFQGVHISRTKAAAIREFRTRAGLAPLQIVRKAISSDKSIDSVFAPKLRYCVCMSSDWRGFQELTTRFDAKLIAETLSSYYEMCNEQLRTHFPAGNYYSDWIADEFFIAIFTDSPLEIMSLAQKSLDFAQSLLEEKAKFVFDRDFPFSIDVGMSVGQAMVGIMGPPEHRKATALGEVPGRSRRLQGTGKLLRYNLGEKDRIIFSEEFAGTLPDNDIVRSFTLEENRKLRDLDCRTLYFVELRQDLLDLLLKQVS